MIVFFLLLLLMFVLLRGAIRVSKTNHNSLLRTYNTIYVLGWTTKKTTRHGCNIICLLTYRCGQHCVFCILSLPDRLDIRP